MQITDAAEETMNNNFVFNNLFLFFTFFALFFWISIEQASKYAIWKKKLLTLSIKLCHLMFLAQIYFLQLFIFYFNFFVLIC